MLRYVMLESRYNFGDWSTSGCVRLRTDLWLTSSTVALRSMVCMSTGRVIASWKIYWARESIWNGRWMVVGVFLQFPDLDTLWACFRKWCWRDMREPLCAFLDNPVPKEFPSGIAPPEIMKRILELRRPRYRHARVNVANTLRVVVAAVIAVWVAYERLVWWNGDVVNPKKSDICQSATCWKVPRLPNIPCWR